MLAWAVTEAVRPVFPVVTVPVAVMIGVTGTGATVTVVLAVLVPSTTQMAVMV